MHQWISTNPPAPWATKCKTCNGALNRSFKINFSLYIVAVCHKGNPDLVIDLNTNLTVDNHPEPVHYDLRGVIYGRPLASHFTSHLITNNSIVFKHDGMLNNGIPILETMSSVGIDFCSCGGGSASVTIYV